MFLYSSYVFNRLNPTYDQALNNLGNLIKVELELSFIERLSIERYETKTKVITLANRKEHREFSEPIKTRRYLHVVEPKPGKTRAGELVRIGFGFASDWKKKWREFFLANPVG